jgi:predicted unusual protein kinase regulating ubiquinone biosynthesis (AarF/ABC1/UbiB family)
MASRVDLLSVQECLELAEIPDEAELTPAALVTALVGRELGCEAEGAFINFEERPFESGLLRQSHRAMLSDGSQVVVKLIHPEAEEQLACDLGLLTLLKDAFRIEGRHGNGIENAIAGFVRAIRQQMDLTNEATALRTLAQDAAEFETLRVQTVLGNLSAARVLTVEQLEGARLADLLASFDGAEDAPEAGVAGRWSSGQRYELARSLCLVWLRQALLGQAFPVSPHAADILLLPYKQLAFTGGRFASLRQETKTNLWEYLVAVSTENLDRACSCLLRELREGRETGGEHLLRQKIRQVVPFRDGGWTGGDGLSLAESLFLHWRLASEHGYEPQPYLPAFYQGLFAIAALARRLSPEQDALLEAWRDMRLNAGLLQMKEMMGLQQMGDQLDKYAALMMELPQKLDDALTHISEDGARLKLYHAHTLERRRQRNFSQVVPVLLVFLAGIVLLSHYVSASAAGSVWVQRASAIVFALFGIMLLVAASRMGGRA